MVSLSTQMTAKQHPGAGCHLPTSTSQSSTASDLEKPIVRVCIILIIILVWARRRRALVGHLSSHFRLPGRLLPRFGPLGSVFRLPQSLAPPTLRLRGSSVRCARGSVHRSLLSTAPAGVPVPRRGAWTPSREGRTWRKRGMREEEEEKDARMPRTFAAVPQRPWTCGSRLPPGPLGSRTSRGPPRLLPAWAPGRPSGPPFETCPWCCRGGPRSASPSAAWPRREEITVRLSIGAFFHFL